MCHDTPGPSDVGRVERMLRRGEGGHRWAAGRLGCRLEGPRQPPGCRSSCGTDTLTPQRKAGLGSPQTLTAGGTSPCEVAELVLSPGCAGPPGDFTKAGAGPPPRCWSVWSGEWLGHQEPTKLPSSPAPRVRPAPGAALGSTGAGGDEGPDSGFLRPFFPHGLQFSLLCDGSRHPFPCVFPPGLGATGEAHATRPGGTELVFGGSYCAIYHCIFFENIAFIPASSELWYRCFQCWAPFLLTCHVFVLVCIFSLPMLVWPGKTDHFNMCCIPITDIPSLFLNKGTNGSTEYIRRERK